MSKIYTLVSAAFALVLGASFTQRVQLSEAMTLQMPGEDGTNSAGLAWHPGKKCYYAVFAGNSSYPMAVFSVSGTRISPGNLTTRHDVRGLWYNPGSKSIEANVAGEGFVRYVLDNNGIPNSGDLLFNNLEYSEFAPDFQSAGTYEPKSKTVIFFHDSRIQSYNPKNGKWKATNKLNLISPESAYNRTSVITVPSHKGQAGILNISDKTVEFYDIKKGKFRGSVSLPSSAPVAGMFGFAWANGYYWIFDVDARAWKGYK